MTFSADKGVFGLVAGAGGLPVAIAEHCRAIGRPLFVLRLDGFADPDLEAYPGDVVNLGQWGRSLSLLKAASVDTVCFCGAVSRPDFSKLVFDELGMQVAPRLLAAAGQGDDALLRAVAEPFAEGGFSVVGAQDILADLLMPSGQLGAVKPGPMHADDIAKALDVARALGALDVGQGAVAAAGVVLAVEAQEGTDLMLTRVAGLPAAIRGDSTRRIGVLAKAPKPMQDRRLDLPVIGPTTIEGAAEAGLAGVVGEAGGVILLERERLIALADSLGLFVLGEALHAP